MPRVSRIYTEEGIFHILTRGNNRQYVFKEEEDFEVYKTIIKTLKDEQPFQLYHWSLMGNHVHLIIEANKKTELSRKEQGVRSQLSTKALTIDVTKV